MDENLMKLFTPFNIGKIKIKNRYVMGPMGINSLLADSQVFDDKVFTYFEERAKGGFGLITTGVQLADTKVDPFDPKTSKSPLVNPGLFRRQLDSLVERLSAYNARLIVQISAGFGRQSMNALTPSPVPNYYKPDQYTSSLTRDQIKLKIEQMIAAAQLMKAGGADGVELHAMHWGYLIDQFATEFMNFREDEYGGNLDNRLRFVKEMIDGIKQTCGESFPVTIRVGVKSYLKAWNKATLTGEGEVGRTLEEGIQICKKLEEMGFDALSLDTGLYDSFYYACPPSYMPKGHGVELYGKVKEAVKTIPILAGSRMGDPYVCAKALEEGKADAFVLSRPSLADPALPLKVAMGTPEKIRPCIGCNVGCIGRLMDKGLFCTCAVNPRAMRETEFVLKKVVTPKKLMVVGGGVAGMTAACLAKQLGHDAELYEAGSRLGGELWAAGNKPLKTEVAELNDWYQRELKDLGVPVHLNSKVSSELIRESKPDVVILAVGATSVMPRSIEGIDHQKSVSALDALTGKINVGDTVVVVGGGEIGCETAMHFVLQGRKVSLIEAMPEIMSVEYVPNQHKNMLKDMMAHNDVTIYTGNKLKAVNDEGAVIMDAKGEEQTLKADTVILSVGMRPNPSLADDLLGEGIEVYEIGSGKKPGSIYNAVHDAYHLVYNL